MLEDAKSYLSKKAQSLDLGRGEALVEIQNLLEQRFPKRTRAKSLNNGVLKVITPSAAVASELRLTQVALIKDFNTQTAYTIERLQISVTSL